MTILSDVGTVGYNGYVFDGASHITIKCEPVYDDAQRTVIYHRYVVDVQTVVASAVGTDLTLLGIRSLLSKAGQILIVENKGFSSLTVNATGGVQDVAFGPKPKIVAWEPIGSLNAAQVTWQCETCIPYCLGPAEVQGLLAFNYAADYSIDHRLMTTRTIAGYLEIAMTRAAPTSGIVPDTADAYRYLVNPTVPERFQRTAQNYHLSLDKRRLEFSLVDTEIPSRNPWPRGVVKVDARHRVNWTRRGGAAAKLRNVLSVDVELAPDQPALNAWAIFEAIAKKRLDIARGEYSEGVLIEDLTAEEDLFGRGASFGIAYTIMAPLKSLLTASGLWAPVTDSTWSQYHASVDNTSGVRGYANLRHSAATDVIIDVCLGAQFPTLANTEGLPAVQQGTSTQKKLQNQTPQPEQSWLQYEAEVAIDRERPVVRQSILQAPDAADQDFNPQDTHDLTYPQPGGTSDILQQGGRGRYTARLTGFAKRAGYPIPKPAVTTVGVASATETGGRFKCKIVGNALGVPIYGAAWDIEYALSNSPAIVQPMANIKQGVAADGTTQQPSEA